MRFLKYIGKRSINVIFFVFNESENGVFIYFINKESFLKVIDDNIDIFLKELGEDFTPTSFLGEIIEEKRSFLEIIHHHEGILGILLGYGRHNSMLFQRKADILGYCWAYDESMKQDCHFLRFASENEELANLDEKLRNFSERHEYSSLVPIAPLGFAADNDHLETQRLKQRYRFARQSINEVFAKTDPIDVIIDMLFAHYKN